MRPTVLGRMARGKRPDILRIVAHKERGSGGDENDDEGQDKPSNSPSVEAEAGVDHGMINPLSMIAYPQLETTRPEATPRRLRWNQREIRPITATLALSLPSPVRTKSTRTSQKLELIEMIISDTAIVASPAAMRRHAPRRTMSRPERRHPAGTDEVTRASHTHLAV